MFDLIERSRFGGRPVHLFRFVRQSKVWRFASCDRDIVIDGVTYLAATIERSEIKQTVERAKDKIVIKLAFLRDPSAIEYPSTQEFGENWFPFVPSDPVQVICMSTHYGATEPPIVEWMGEVTQPTFSDVELELTCEPSNGADRARNQGAKWQRTCGKTVYSVGRRGCNLSRDAFKVEAVAGSVAGLVVAAPEFATAPLNLSGGSLTWLRSNGLVERRSIMTHSGASITLLSAAHGLDAGMSVEAVPGCPRTWAGCQERNNTIHYGGSLFKKEKNSMDGVSMSWG